MSDFPINVKVDPGDAVPRIDGVANAVAKAEKRVDNLARSFSLLEDAFARQARTTEVHTRLTNNLAIGWGRLGEVMERRARATEVHSRLNSTFAKSFESVAHAIAEERTVLESIRGPFERYQQQVRVLDSLLARGKLTTNEYTAALREAGRAANLPTSGPKGFFGAASSGLQQGIGIPGGAGGLGASLGTSLAGMVGPAALIGTSLSVISEEFDRWAQHDRTIISATNSMLRFHDTAEEAAASVDEQVKASQLLGVAVGEQIEAYDAVTDATESMAKSHSQLMDITRNLSMVMIHEGKSMGDVNRVMETLQFGMSKGSLETRELRGIIKEFPPIADMWSKSLGKSREEILKMAANGQIGRKEIMQMVTAFEDGADISKLFAERQLDINKVMDDQHVSFTEAMEIVIRHKQTVQDAMKPIEGIEILIRRWNQALDEVSATMGDIDEKLDKADLKYWQDSFGSQHVKNLKAVTDGVKAYESSIRKAKQELEEYNRELERAAKLEPRLRNVGDGSRHKSFVLPSEVAAGTEIDTSWMVPIAQRMEYERWLEDISLAAQKYRRDMELANDGVARGFAKIESEIRDTASLTENLLVNSFHNLEDSIVQASLTGELSFSKMIDAFIADMARLAARQAALGLLNLFSPSPTLAGTPGAGTLIDPLAWGSAGLDMKVPAFSSGGTGIVRGNGMTDTTPVMIWATQGERLTVQTQGQQMAAREMAQRQSSPSPAQPMTVVLDDRALARLMRTRLGAQVIDDLNSDLLPR